ncbi:frataxin domain-containing protein [Endozoicomonas montiporae]|uniref:frataxin domain-containing protein n=1 Tax=Endozoicomonas montiporae TaxID=1027273 RepID=UPI001F1E964A
MQLWLAAKSGGFHFDFDAGKGEWVCKGELLIEVLDRCLCDQCEKSIALKL